MAIAIELMIAGGIYLPPQFASFATMTGGADEIDTGAKRLPGDLTRRQQAILDLLGSGASNKEIALRLQLSVGTVKNYVSGLLKMMQIPTRSRLVAQLRHRDGTLVDPWCSSRVELLNGWMNEGGPRRM